MGDKKILVVEDESIVALDIKNKLKSLGFIVPCTVFSGEEAVEKAYEIQPDLILMDIILNGEMDGIAAAQKILETLDIPIIYLTANTNSEILKRTNQIGNFKYITKPFDEKQLENAVKKALKTV